jgi:hypothetical protein
MNVVENAPCGCQVIGVGTESDPFRNQFCPMHLDQQGTIIVTLIRMEQLKQAIVARDWPDTEFQFDRVLRALTKQMET